MLFSYGRGLGEPPWDLRLAPSPRWTSPRAMRSGPQWGKPLADWALRRSFLAASLTGAFDCALAHNAEAAFIALSARRRSGVPVVYVAHTLLCHELSAYGPRACAPLADRLGAVVDRRIARRADAILALCEPARQALAVHARGPVAVVPPGLDPRPAPPVAEQAELCERLGLEPGRFALYAGNLDRYQELDLLAAASLRQPAGAWPIVVATHDPERLADRGGHPGGRLRAVALERFEEMRALTHAAGLLLLTRRRPGGFPVKLLNYMEAGRAILAFTGVAEGLRHAESAWLLPATAVPEDLVRAIEALAADAALRERLGAAARRHLETAHSWHALARRTLALLEQLPSPPAARRP